MIGLLDCGAFAGGVLVHAAAAVHVDVAFDDDAKGDEDAAVTGGAASARSGPRTSRNKTRNAAVGIIMRRQLPWVRIFMNQGMP